MVFGLSMDYEVFLVSRMREEWDNGLSNNEAVAQGLAKTGRIVTAAGLIMFAAFMGFVAGSIVGLQQFGFGLAMAILLDVTIVRALLVPSVMELFGRWNWWLPAPIARIGRVEPSPLREPVPRPRSGRQGASAQRSFDAAKTGRGYRGAPCARSSPCSRRPPRWPSPRLPARPRARASASTTTPGSIYGPGTLDDAARPAGPAGRRPRPLHAALGRDRDGAARGAALVRRRRLQAGASAPP